MKQGRALPECIRTCSLGLLLLVLTSAVGWAQQPSPAPNGAQAQEMVTAIQQLQQQVQELRSAVAEIRAEAAQYRSETEQLRHELELARGQASRSTTPEAGSEPVSGQSSAGPSPAQSSAAAAESADTGALEKRVDALEETTQLLNSKVDDQYQTKVSSGSKYRVRLSGIALLNVFGNRGSADNIDFPTWADIPGPLSTPGNFGATMRQSELGLEVFGPKFAGARTSGNLQVDFAGGFPAIPNGVSFGLMRLRIATMRLDWEHTSLIAGQDGLFVSPLSPTSFASLAEPALTYTGNLWGWTPQVRLEHRIDISDEQNVAVQVGVFDNLTGEFSGAYDRSPQAGEASGQPAYGTRVAWTHTLFGEPLTLGAAGYYSPQNWGFNRYVGGWSGMSDWQIPLGSRFLLSGEFYRGNALGGLGASFTRSTLVNGNIALPTTPVIPWHSIGGWSQLKFKATSKLEFNGAFGIDSPFAGQLRAVAEAQNFTQAFLQRNRGTLLNFVYRPRSDLLLSAEYRHLRTFYNDNSNPKADQINMSMGILF